MDRGVGHAFEKTLQDPGGDEVAGPRLGQDRCGQGEKSGGQDPRQENPLASVAGGQEAAWDLGEDITVEEGAQDET